MVRTSQNTIQHRHTTLYSTGHTTIFTCSDFYTQERAIEWLTRMTRAHTQWPHTALQRARNGSARTRNRKSSSHATGGHVLRLRCRSPSTRARTRTTTPSTSTRNGSWLEHKARTTTFPRCLFYLILLTQGIVTVIITSLTRVQCPCRSHITART